MTRKEYRKARQLVRENGPYGLRFIERKTTTKVAEEFDNYYRNIFLSQDKLQERAEMVQYCQRENIVYNFRQIM